MTKKYLREVYAEVSEIAKLYSLQEEITVEQLAELADLFDDFSTKNTAISEKGHQYVKVAPVAVKTDRKEVMAKAKELLDNARGLD
ncbi:MAG: hypothetical protein GY774_39975 [Planctomycetes bacterium]|nr:hypothetical protein [Planctomycetota bacterium]